MGEAEMRPVLTPEEVKERKRAANAQWRAQHKEECRAAAAKYYAKEREELHRIRREIGRL
jgi:hypothetical protein